MWSSSEYRLLVMSVLSDEVKNYWPGLRRAGDRVDTKNSPQKFREAGIKEVVEAVWVSKQD